MLFALWTIACLGKVETAEDFEVAYAESQCHAYRQCHRSLFDGKYDGMADCQDTLSQTFAEENQTLLGSVNSK